MDVESEQRWQGQQLVDSSNLQESAPLKATLLSMSTRDRYEREHKPLILINNGLASYHFHSHT